MTTMPDDSDAPGQTTMGSPWWLGSFYSGEAWSSVPQSIRGRFKHLYTETNSACGGYSAYALPRISRCQPGQAVPLHNPGDGPLRVLVNVPGGTIGGIAANGPDPSGC